MTITFFGGSWSKHRNKGEHRIVHILPQSPFEDWRPKFERDDVWISLKVWSAQTSAHSNFGHSYCHSYSAEVWTCRCKSFSGYWSVDEYVCLSDPETKCSNDLFEVVEIIQGPLLATPPPYPHPRGVSFLQ